MSGDSLDRAATSALRVGRSIVAAALCAQAPHAALYGSLLPTGSPHGYLTWYVPVLLVLSVSVLALIPASLGANALATGRRSFEALLPERNPGRPVRDIAQLTLSAGAFFLVQESLERSAEAGNLQVATFAPFAWLVLGLVLLIAAGVVVAVERTLDALVDRRTVEAGSTTTQRSAWATKHARVVRRHPLSLHGGLRAPPTPV